MMQISDVAMIRRAQQHFSVNQYEDAERFCSDLLRRNPKHYQALLLMMDMAWNRGDQKRAIETAKQLVGAYPNDGFVHSRLAEVFNRLARHLDAERLLERFLKRNPGNPEAVCALAQTLDYAGEGDRAIALLEPLLAAGKATPAMAHRFASIQFERKNYPLAIEVESQIVSSANASPEIREEALYLLGRAHEAGGNYDAAFAAYAAANNVLPSDTNLDKAFDEYQRLTKAFSADWMKRLPRARSSSRLPVFIVCRPRSGSTLVERIIASHPAVHAGGELEILKNISDQMNLTIGSSATFPECVHDLDQQDVDMLGQSFLSDLQGLAPRAQRVTNKHLGSWKFMGLLALLAPNSVIIDLRRDAVDNCLGIYTAQLIAARAFTRDLRQIGLLHREYERVMEHWHKTLDLPILKVNYEDLVADQETWSRKIIDFCGLEWDDRCLRFYEKEAQHSSTALPTLSHHQVRQPIYKTSVSRAKKFEKHLGPLYEALGLPTPTAGDDLPAAAPAKQT